MDKLSRIFFSPWLNKDEIKAVEAHQLKNFTYIRYQKKDNPQKELFGRYNRVTKEVMWFDEAPIIGFKCSWILTIGVPVELALREIFYTAELIHLVFQTIICRKKISDLPSNLSKTLSNMARAVFYLTGILFAALGGILFDPLRARKRIGLLAVKLNHGVTLSEHRKIEKDAKQGKATVKTKMVLYLAPCMQPWVATFNNSSWTTLKMSDNFDEVSVNKKVKQCPCSRWCIFPLLPGCVN
jgi:hypothetical protein